MADLNEYARASTKAERSKVAKIMNEREDKMLDATRKLMRVEWKRAVKGR